MKKRIVCDTDLNKFRFYKTGSKSLRSLSVQAFILLYKQIINFILQTNKTHKILTEVIWKLKECFMVYLEGLVLSLNNFSFCLTKQCANLSKHSWTFLKFNHILYINNLYSRIFYEIIKDTNSCKQPKFVLFPNDRKPLYLLYDINSGTFCTLLHKFWELSCGYLW